MVTMAIYGPMVPEVLHLTHLVLHHLLNAFSLMIYSFFPGVLFVTLVITDTSAIFMYLYKKYDINLHLQ